AQPRHQGGPSIVLKDLNFVVLIIIGAQNNQLAGGDIPKCYLDQDGFSGAVARPVELYVYLKQIRIQFRPHISTWRRTSGLSRSNGYHAGILFVTSEYFHRKGLAVF